MRGWKKREAKQKEKKGGRHAVSSKVNTRTCPIHTRTHTHTQVPTHTHTPFLHLLYLSPSANSFKAGLFVLSCLLLVVASLIHENDRIKESLSCCCCCLLINYPLSKAVLSHCSSHTHIHNHPFLRIAHKQRSTDDPYVKVVAHTL